MFEFVLAGAAFALVSNAGHVSTSMRVDYSDLDLSSEQGRQTLEERIAVASRRVCSRAGDRSLRHREDYHKCRTIAVRDVNERLKLAIAKDRAERSEIAAAR